MTDHRETRIRSMANAMIKAIGIHEASGSINGDEYAEAYLRAFMEYSTAKHGPVETLRILDQKGADVLVGVAYSA